MTPEFRRVLYMWRKEDAPSGDEESSSIPHQLQLLFAHLQLSRSRSVSTKALTVSFGWSSSESFQQHDVQELSRVLFDRYGLLPVGGDRHSSEFFPYYFGKRTGNGKLFGMKEIDFPARAKGRAESKARLESWIAGKEDPWDMDKPSGEEAHHIITSVIRNSCHVNPAVNILNNGCMSNIPDDHCVEVPAVVGQYGIKPLSLGKLPENIVALIGRMGSIYKYTVEAAVTGDKKLVMKALVLDPLLQEYENADKLLNELIESQKKYLPKFK